MTANENITKAMKLRGMLMVIKLYGTSIMLQQLLHLVYSSQLYILFGNGLIFHLFGGDSLIYLLWVIGR